MSREDSIEVPLSSFLAVDPVYSDKKIGPPVDGTSVHGTTVENIEKSRASVPFAKVPPPTMQRPGPMSVTKLPLAKAEPDRKDRLLTLVVQSSSATGPTFKQQTQSEAGGEQSEQLQQPVVIVNATRVPTFMQEDHQPLAQAVPLNLFRRRLCLLSALLISLASIATAVGVLLPLRKRTPPDPRDEIDETVPTTRIEVPSPVFVQVGVDIDALRAGERLGDDVKLSSDGSILATGGSGSAFDPVHGFDGLGRIRIFQLNGSEEWTRLGNQDAMVGSRDETFGGAIALSANGTIVATGARMGLHSNGIDKTGRVVAYRYDPSRDTWKQLGQILFGAIQSPIQSWFGLCVALSDDGFILAVGAPLHINEVGTAAGHVSVFRYNGDIEEWEPYGADILGEEPFGQFGWSVSLSSDGSTLASGAYLNDALDQNNAGHVRVYGFNGSEWEQIAQDLDGEAEEDLFGSSVVISSSGSVVAAGGILAANRNGTSAGQVRVYALGNDDVWELLGEPIFGSSLGDQLGSSIALCNDGNTLVVGAAQSTTTGFPAGYVRIFQFQNGEQWIQEGDDLVGENQGDAMGSSVACSLNGTIVAAGAPFNGVTNIRRNAGHVRVFRKYELSAR